MTKGHATNLTGLRCGRLTGESGRAPNRGGHSYWLCVCACGNECTVAGRHIRGMHASTFSCGCLRDGVVITREHRLKAAAAAQASKLRAARLAPEIAKANTERRRMNLEKAEVRWETANAASLDLARALGLPTGAADD